jgi:anaphase-promoting complex subunit 4
VTVSSFSVCSFRRMQSSIDLLASFQLPSAARLLPTALCPDKDLLLLVTSLNNKDRLSLWNLQGSKKWEVEVDASGPNPEEIVALTWSPDCAW